jgi:hypothetical protein
MEIILNEDYYFDLKLSKTNVDLTNTTPLFPIIDFNFTLLDSTFLTSPTLILPQISGQTFDTHISSNGTSFLFEGGFYQGSYFQSNPTLFDGDWSIKTILKPTSTSNNTINNILHNDNVFFTFGVKEQNIECLDKYYDFVENTHPTNENSFIWFQEHGTCEKIKSVVLKNCCDILENNMFSLFLTTGSTQSTDCMVSSIDKYDYNIGLRTIISSGTCISGITYNELIIHEKISHGKPVKIDSFNEIVVIFKKNNVGKNGVLKIYVDGFLVLTDNITINLRTYGNTPTALLNSGSTYNMSVGGGTLGWIENEQFLNPTEKTLYDYEFCVTDLVNLTVDNIITDVAWLEPYLVNNLAVLHLTEKKITLLTYKTIVESNVDCCVKSEIIETILPLLPKNTYLIPKPNFCTLLEENFTSSFIGEIKEFKIFDVPITFNQIRHVI